MGRVGVKSGKGMAYFMTNRSAGTIVSGNRVNEIFDLTGKVAVVTGGAGGIGTVYGRALAEAGAAVALADLDGGAANEQAAKLAAEGHQAIGVKLDITNP